MLSDKDQFYYKKKIILSLTSYGKRIETVHLAIQTLLSQTKMADKIILWLSEDEFNRDNIPEILKKLVEKGKLEVEFCKDIGSYKKLIPSLVKYPNEIIITFDDDIFYSKYVVEKLYNAYLKNTNIIHCMRGHLMKYNKNEELMSYKNWKKCPLFFKPSLDIFPTSGAGTLFVREFFPSEVFEENVFMKLAPHADDVWFKAMSLKKGIKCQIVKRPFWKNTKKLSTIDGTQRNGLWQINFNETTGNNPQIKAVFEKYGLAKVTSIKKYKDGNTL